MFRFPFNWWWLFIQEETVNFIVRYCELIIAIQRRMSDTGIMERYTYFFTPQENHEYDELYDKFGYFSVQKAQNILRKYTGGQS